jgi:hypothetical protein
MGLPFAAAALRLLSIARGAGPDQLDAAGPFRGDERTTAVTEAPAE